MAGEIVNNTALASAAAAAKATTRQFTFKSSVTVPT